MKLKFKRDLVLSLGAAAILAGGNALAADKELLDMLVKNGAIDKKQYDTLMKKATVSTADGSNIVTKLNEKGLSMETSDKNFSFKVNGRLHADSVWHGDDGKTANAGRVDEDGTHGGTANDANDGVGIRRARIEFSGTFWKDWNWRMQYEFANNTKPLFKDMWIQYAGWDVATLTVGEQKRPISLQQMMSSNDMVFTERSMDYAFIAPLERAIGLRADSSGANWSAGIGVFGDSINGNSSAASTTDNTKDDQGWSVAGRATWAPINDKDKVFHVGASGSYTETEDSVDDTHGKAKFSVKPTGVISDFTLLDTGTMRNVRDYTNVNVEAAAVYGPFSTEAEYTRSFIARENDGGASGSELADLTFDGWHADVHYTLTGESRHYNAKTGTFGRVKPNRNFDLAGGLGAWEMGARIMQIDMNDESFKAGRATGSSFALNWYPNQNIRFMADYTHLWDVDNTNRVSGDDPADLDYVQLRGQLAF
jgi:phosphate-selective porin OprO/OprP